MTELPMEKYVRDSLIFIHLAESTMRQVKVGKLLAGWVADGGLAD
jgi:hypothetical protein